MRYGKKMILAKLCILAVLCGLTSGAAQAGPRGGGRYDMHRVHAGSTDTFNLTFYGGEEAVVFIEGDGDTDLDLYVYDGFGNLIASDTDGTDTCLVRFVPKWTGNIEIRVRNLGYVYNVYKILAN